MEHGIPMTENLRLFVAYFMPVLDRVLDSDRSG